MDSGNLINTRLGKYFIQAEIGRGGMGAVYRAFDPDLNRHVAVKILAPHLVGEKEFVERFLREARAAAGLKHPAIVTIHDVGHEGNWYYIVMEYLEGQSLAEVIHRRGALPSHMVLAILKSVAEALDYAHKRGLIHRDIKSANIIIDPSGTPTLTDFGIARATQETRLTRTGAVLGTPEYMSPEQVQGRGGDAWSDQYSLAVVVYEMLSGRVPLQAESPLALMNKVAHEPPPPIRQTRPDLTAASEQVLAKALAKRPGDRYPTVTAFAEALRRALTGEPVAVPRPPPVPQPRPSPGPGRGILIALGAAGFVLAGLFVVLLVALFGGQTTEPPPPTGMPTPTGTPTPVREQITPEPTTAAAVTDTATPEPPSPTPLPVTETPTPEPPSPTPIPITDTPSLAEREAELLSTLQYRRSNGDAIFAYQAATRPTVDGWLGEWSGHQYEIDHVVFEQDAQGRRQGRDDVYGRFLIAWDADNLYLGVEVTDDFHVQTQSGALIWQGDDVEIQIDADLLGDWGDSNLSSDDGQLGFSAGDFGFNRPEAYIWLPAALEQPGTMIPVKAQQTSGGYTLEAAIPWWALGGRPPVETGVGFCLSLSDNDIPGTAQQQTLISTSPLRAWRNPTTWGTLVLVDWR